ncbi:MAG: hypothetical protein RR506_08530, partial [Akkermansia sp.]
RDTNKDREWLGRQCGGASKRTVDTWLSPSGIMPEKATTIIHNLMESPQDKKGNVVFGNTNIVLNIPTEDLLDFQKNALESGMSIKEWIIEVLKSAGRNPDEASKAITEDFNGK